MVENGVVTNIIVVPNDEFQLDGVELVSIPDGFGIGDLYTNGVWTKAENPQSKTETREPTTEEILLTALIEIQELKQKVAELEGK